MEGLVNKAELRKLIFTGLLMSETFIQLLYTCEYVIFSLPSVLNITGISHHYISS